MFTLAISRRQDDRPAARRPGPRRRPQVEDLEGRQLLSTASLSHTVAPVTTAIVGNHIGTSVAAIVGNHIGTSVAAIKGQHVGS
jgi:hypothetical protein